jgi:hypothetical protein
LTFEFIVLISKYRVKLGISAPRRQRGKRRNVNGNKQTDLLQVVSVDIPDPSWIQKSQTKSVFFGKHYGPYDLSREWKTPMCEAGDMVFVVLENGTCFECSETTYNTDRILQFAVRCRKCGFIMNLYAKSWKDAVIEWMTIAIGTFLKELEVDDDYISLAAPIKRNIKICIPKNAKIWYKKQPGNHSTPYIIWPDYEVATELTSPCNMKSYYSLLLVDAGILMTEIENILHESIKKSSLYACSASRKFHPDTRRNNGGK